MPADRSSTLTVLSALLLSIGGNLCQLYSGKPLLYSGTATELPSAGTIAEVLQRELSAYASNTTCPSRSSSVEDSCPACVCAATTCPAPEPTRFWNTATAGALASSLGSLAIAIGLRCQRLVTGRPAPRPASVSPSTPAVVDLTLDGVGKWKPAGGGPLAHLAVDASHW